MIRSTEFRINNYLIKIKNSSPRLDEVVESFVLFIQPYLSPHKKDKQIAPHVITLSLTALAPTQKQPHRAPRQQRISFVMKKGKKGFVMSTPAGSTITTDFTRHFARGKLAEKDGFRFIFLMRWLHTYLFLSAAVRIHAAFIQKSTTSGFLLTGQNETGKTTLSNMLNNTQGFLSRADDECLLYMVNDRVWFYDIKCLFKKRNIDVAFDFRPLCPTHLFFLKRINENSRIIPLSKKDAFTQICFLSEFPPYEEEFQKHKRIDLLKRLVKQCRCYSLVNGNGLNNNPALLSQLVTKTVVRT